MKFLYTCLIVGCFLGSVWTYNLIFGKPDRFNLFVERVLIEQALSDPELITYLGALNNTPLDFFNGKLTDISYQSNMASLQKIRNSLTILLKYDRSQLSPQEQISYDILKLYLQNILEDASFSYGSRLNSSGSDLIPYPVNQLFGMQSFLPDFMVNIHPIADRNDAKMYIARLNQWDKKFSDLITELKLREKSGVVPPDFVIQKVLNEIRRFTQLPEANNLLYTSFQNKLAALNLSALERQKLESGALHAIEAKVYPSYLQLLSFLEEQLNSATHDAGIWKLPNGDAYYAFCLRYHTTTNKSPAQVHALGLSEVARIQAEMKQIADTLGYEGQQIISVMQQLAKDPRFLYPNTNAGRTQVLADYQKLFDQIQDKMKQLFSKFPKAPLRIEPIPAFKAQSGPMAYYEPGDLKGARPGIFYVNTHDMNNQAKFIMPALAYHEGIPGHHFQIARALEIEHVPTLRKIVPFTAYQEGWALYCEQLAKEAGFITDPYADLGRLQLELMRAVRLVVDTGLHYQRWSREQAIQYMMDNTGQNESEVVSEIERYVVMPGQACSYKIGMIKILELREKMKARLGADFDIKAFHEIVLQDGAMPLHLLEQRVDTFLENKKNSLLGDIMTPISLSKTLNDFLDQSHETIVKLQDLEREELANEPNFDAGPCEGPYRQNKQTADSVNKLRTSAQAINVLLLTNSSLLNGCEVTQLDTDFCGEGFKEHQYGEALSCCQKLITIPNNKTLDALQKTMTQVKIAEEQGLAIYNYLNPEHPREIPWRIACTIL